MKKKKIALVELTLSHQECIYSHLKYLNTHENDIFLILNEELKNKISPLNGVLGVKYFNIQDKSIKYFSLTRICLFLLSNKFDLIIFNTSEKEVFKFAVFPFLKKSKLIGVIHDLTYLENGYQHKLLTSRISNFLVLNDYLLKYSEKFKNRNLSFKSFYAIQFPDIKSIISKKTNEIWIAVPGSINCKRRDYEIFINAIIPVNVKIILLGSSNTEDGVEFKQKIKKHKNVNQFLTFDDFLDNNLIYDYIKKSDFILPLIHRRNLNFHNYLETKTSGSFNLAFGFKKPMLLDKVFENISDFKDTGLFYDSNNFNQIFTLIEANKDIEFYKNPKWQFDFQKAKYMDVINYK